MLREINEIWTHIWSMDIYVHKYNLSTATKNHLGIVYIYFPWMMLMLICYVRKHMYHPTKLYWSCWQDTISQHVIYLLSFIILRGPSVIPWDVINVKTVCRQQQGSNVLSQETSTQRGLGSIIQVFLFLVLGIRATRNFYHSLWTTYNAFCLFVCFVFNFLDINM